MTPPQLESMEDDLFRLARIVGSTPALRGALTDRDLEAAAHAGPVTDLLEGKVPSTTVAWPATPSPGGGPATSWAPWTTWSS